LSFLNWLEEEFLEVVERGGIRPLSFTSNVSKISLKGVTAFQIWRDEKLDIKPFVLGEAFLQSPDKRGLAAAYGAIQIDRSNAIPGHEFTFGEPPLPGRKNISNEGRGSS
jgi:hypothetical protein